MRNVYFIVCLFVFCANTTPLFAGIAEYIGTIKDQSTKINYLSLTYDYDIRKSPDKNVFPGKAAKAAYIQEMGMFRLVFNDKKCYIDYKTTGGLGFADNGSSFSLSDEYQLDTQFWIYSSSNAVKYDKYVGGSDPTHYSAVPVEDAFGFNNVTTLATPREIKGKYLPVPPEALLGIEMQKYRSIGKRKSLEAYEFEIPVKLKDTHDSAALVYEALFDEHSMIRSLQLSTRFSNNKSIIASRTTYRWQQFNGIFIPVEIKQFCFDKNNTPYLNTAITIQNLPIVNPAPNTTPEPPQIPPIPTGNVVLGSN